MDALIPLVTHGLDNCFSLRLEMVLIGACLFINLFTLLKKVENNLRLFSGSVTTKSQFISESSWLNKVSENDE